MKYEYNLYCDLDGVLTNFSKGYYNLTGVDLNGRFYNNKNFWEPIDKAGRKFWSDLEWMKDGKKLWSYIEKYNPEILSAPSDDVSSRVGKFDWVKRELPGVHLNLRSMEYKKEFANPQSILIDDNETNVLDWNNAGGIAIHHKSAKETIKKLKELGL